MATLNELSFSKSDTNGRYESTAVQVAGDFGLSLVFSDSITEEVNAKILQSIDGENYEDVAIINFTPAVQPSIQRNVTGIADGAYIVISCTDEPTSGGILA